MKPATYALGADTEAVAAEAFCIDELGIRSVEREVWNFLATVLLMVKQMRMVADFRTYLFESKLNWLLVFVLISTALAWLSASKIWLFVTSALAIVPLAALVSAATQQLARRTGPGVGGLINASCGNISKFIIDIFALRAGLISVVKASISGCILGNILFVLGATIEVAGEHEICWQNWRWSPNIKR